jgi:hypothetical protein
MITKLKNQTIIAIITTLSLWNMACTNDPNGFRKEQYKRDTVADIIAKNEYDKQQTTVTIVDRNEALGLLNSEVK